MKTLERSVRLVEELGELTDPGDFASIVLPALAEIVGCDVVTYNEVGAIPAQVRYEDWPPRSLNPQTRQTFARLANQHPCIAHYRRSGDFRPVMISDFLSTPAFHRLDLYGEFFRGIPVEHQLSVSLTDHDETVIGIALNRARTDFDDVNRAVLAVLRRPLLSALKRARLRHQLPSSALSELSTHERSIVELVALGRTNASIARTLGVSPRTVAKHLEHVYRKLNVGNRAAAVASIQQPAMHLEGEA